MPIGISGAILGGSAISGLTSLIGGATSASAAEKAAAEQRAGIDDQIAFQKSVLQQIQSYVSPFINFGTGAISALANAIPNLSAGIDPGVTNWAPDLATLEKTPGYQFTLQEGLKATQSGAAAAGLGRGGPSIEGAQKFATGLASTTEQQMFDQYYNQQSLKITEANQQLASRQQSFNMLAAPPQLALNALAAGLGGAQSSITGIGNALASAGAATAAGTIGSANAFTAGLTGAGSAASGAGSQLASIYALQQAFGGGGGGGAGTLSNYANALGTVSNQASGFPLPMEGPTP